MIDVPCPDKYFIYGLFNDQTKELVYVGVTAYPEQRLYNHKATTVKGFAKFCRMEIFEESNRLNHKSIESAWINEMAGLGCNLINRHIPSCEYDLCLDIQRKGLSPLCIRLYWLKNEMVSRGTTCQALAIKAGVSLQTVYKARKGNSINVNTAKRIASALRTNVEKLI